MEQQNDDEFEEIEENEGENYIDENGQEMEYDEQEIN